MQAPSILVLGCRGFIGSNITKHFLGKGYNVAGCDLVEYPTGQYQYHKLSLLSPDFDDFISANNFFACINAAGSGSVPYSIEHPFNDFEANATAVAKVLSDIARRQPACRFVHLSSAAVYGNPAALPVSESHAAAPMSPYGYHKLASEIICREYHDVFGLPIAVIRPFSVYGQGLYKQLLWDICSRLKQNEAIELFGTGSETRDFINIVDFCAAIELVLEKGSFKNDIYNLGNGDATSIRELANIFMQCYPGAKKIFFNGQQKKGDPLHWQAGINKIASLGYKKSITLEEGVERYINWFLQQQ